MASPRYWSLQDKQSMKSKCYLRALWDRARVLWGKIFTLSYLSIDCTRSSHLRISFNVQLNLCGRTFPSSGFDVVPWSVCLPKRRVNCLCHVRQSNFARFCHGQAEKFGPGMSSWKAYIRSSWSFCGTVSAMCSLFFMDPLPKGQCSECIEERADGILTEWAVGLVTLKDSETWVVSSSPPTTRMSYVGMHKKACMDRLR